MTEPASHLILHHYPVSPFAEKARAMLGFKGLAWKSVQIPLFMPKPDVIALTGGYRKTPILQLGADIYCDTALIARVLERIAPAPSLFPQGETLAVRAAAHFADHVVFGITIPIGFQPGAGMMKQFFSGATPEFLAAFGKDRAAMRQGGTVRRGPLHECKANLQGLLGKIEAQLTGPYLFGGQACIADFSLYNALWPLWKPADMRVLLDPFPKTKAFVERMAAIGHGKPGEISSGDAIQIAKSSTPDAVKGAVALETGGIALGEQALAMPVDSGLDPVTGELLNASADEIVIRRTDPRAGTVHVHFPRFGYQLNKPS
ncbi:MAG TPA: glutathione S-transferase family protein [Burkholderiales bacterium]|nr:glutathione S-transferase family protein [Burkholderiales bacterium]